MSRSTRLAAISGMLLTLCACQDDLPKASQIVHMRVLGATTRVVGDPQRSSPKPGETAELTWSMVYPDLSVDDSQLSALFIVCSSPGQFTGTPVCQEFIDSARGGNFADLFTGFGGELPDCRTNPNRVYRNGSLSIVCVTGTPKLEVAIPADTTATSRLIRGIICRNGTPKVDRSDPRLTSCAPMPDVAPAAIEDVAVYGTVPIQYPGTQGNQNPRLDSEAAQFFFHDPPVPWNETPEDLRDTLSDDTCLDEAKAERVMHSEGAEETITLRYDASLREQLDGEPEGLEFSGYSSFGELSRRFTIFRSDAELPLSDTFTWELAQAQREALNGSSKHVRFYFTVIDHRGGFAVTSRDLCIDRQ